MKNYYIKQINLEKIKLSKLNIHKKYKSKRLLTPYGMIHCKNDVFQKKKIVSNGCKIHENTINNYTIYENDIKWVNYTKMDSIPDNHVFLDVNVYEIKLDPYSKTVMKVECIDQQINDLYISSDKEIDDFFFKKDLGLFIKMIM